MKNIAWTPIKEYSDIKFEFFEGIAKVTINRPQVYNAFRPETNTQMIEAFDICRERSDVRVVVLTGYGAIATAVAAVKIGAVDYLSKPADAADIVNALLARGEDLPPPPENPMSADRVRWEHIQRVFELCDRNVSETARRLNMHRRTLQRILAKRSPR